MKDFKVTVSELNNEFEKFKKSMTDMGIEEFQSYRVTKKELVRNWTDFLEANCNDMKMISTLLGSALSALKSTNDIIGSNNEGSN